MRLLCFTTAEKEGSNGKQKISAKTTPEMSEDEKIMRMALAEKKAFAMKFYPKYDNIIESCAIWLKKLDDKDDADLDLQRCEEPLADLTIVDQMTQTTYKQRYSLRVSWKGIRREFSTTAILFFAKLFSANAHYQSFFNKFRQIKPEELFKQPVFIKHSNLITAAIDMSIMKLHKIDSYLFLVQLGAYHRDHKIVPEFFDLKKPFMETIQKILDDRFTTNIENVYNKLIDYIILGLKDGVSIPLT
ncbi:hypothetical protein SNEBB_006900 [Seison nebaliae]|nr:hypothetical protein SNEBB_006900 [Seison nebaliae]